MTNNPQEDIHKLVQAQFGPVASAYTISVGHANRDALEIVVNLAQPLVTDRALDIATGAGHTAMALAPHVAEVIAYDLTSQMLEETAQNAAKRNLTNLVTKQGTAESLPFPDNTFDIVTVRVAPHHFASIKSAVLEMGRVVKPGGRVVVVDTTVPEDDTLDQEINYIEKLRDPSHVRNYRSSEWVSMLQEAGLKIFYNEVDYYTEQGQMNFANWTGRMRTPPAAVTELTELFRNASPELVQALEIKLEGDEIFFSLPKVTIGSTK
ncbi:MAG: methyltransferase domain-containing protein [Chloroflexi bacterium]|uniref:Methyltransferase domain-containing protein n=1 Tax=Candidatus Chlorohelix allophototropha TaxID=3003348 RepID=A0A8T7M5R7_9CHLR|nr:methyltransferase domain-containing protein [Chloroflexota bacterium]WJW69298.1 methyltransferase domain-containing protein [Chloroflexota bacterium L227-S17]